MTLLATLVSVVTLIYILRMIKSKKINYELTSISSYIGVVGVGFIIYGFIFMSFIFPVSYVVHQIIKQPYRSSINVIKGQRTTIMGIGWTLKPFYVTLENNNLKTRYYINGNMYSLIKSGDSVEIYGYKSLIGYSFDRIKPSKTNKYENVI